MKTIHYPNKIKFPLADPKSTSKLRSVLHFRYSIAIRRLIPRANTAQYLITVITLLTTTTLFVVTIYCAQ